MTPSGYAPPPPRGYPPPPPAAGPHGAPDPKAVLALVLGILSVTCGGLLLGVPAILFGVSAKRQIERAGGAVGGGGLAMGGIIAGIIGTVSSIVVMVGVCAVLLLSPHPTKTTPAHRVSPGIASRASVGHVDVVQLSGSEGPLEEQLASELARARGSKKVLIVQTTATWCTVCDEIDASLDDPRMQTALTNVQLVRVDVDEFRSELMIQKMWEGTVPWFYKIDSAAHPVDAISADEWDENVAKNMAPVLRSFAAGTLTNRRHATQIGTAL